jgi:hypothetical protein
MYILIIISYSHAENIIINKNNFISNYKIALEDFKSKNYEEAYISLYSLFQKKSDNLNINFYLGRSAYETKRYNEAILAYQRFLFIEPNNSRIKLEMARSYYILNEYKESKKLLFDVKRDKNIPSFISDLVDIYLKSINNKIQKNSINGIFMIGTFYDSNINNRSTHDTFSDTYFPAADTYIDVTNSTEDSSNWYNQEIVIINHKYKIYDDVIFKNDFLIFNKDSFDSVHDDTKLTLASYTPSISVKHTEKLIIDYALYTDFLSYAGNSKLKTFAVLPKFEYLYDTKNKISGYIKYQNIIDLQNTTQNKLFIEAKLNLLHLYSKTLALTSRIIFTSEEAKDSTQTTIDYKAVKGFLALNYQAFPTLSFTPNISYSISKYDSMDDNYLVKKKNEQLKIGLTSNYAYTPKWILQHNIDYTKQTSNIDLNEYNKYTFGLNIIRIF